MVDVNNPLYQKDLETTFPYFERLLQDGDKSVLIIGATGLIGSFLTDALLSYNAKKAAKIKIHASGRSVERLRTRFGYAESSYLHLEEQDIRNPLSVEEAYDYIFHLASNADPGTYKKYPYETITTNVIGATNVIEYAKQHRKTQIIFTSTMEVYGEIQKAALQENEYGAINFNELRAGYPESKRIAELMYRSAVAEYGIHATIARMGYIYGPTMSDSDNKIIAEFIRNKATGKDIVLKSTGTQRRTYCYVADAVTGMVTVLTEGESGQAYNVADEKSEVSLRELAELFQRKSEISAISKTMTVDSHTSSDNKIYDTVLDVHAVKELGWQAVTNLETGIKHSLECLL